MSGRCVIISAAPIEDYKHISDNVRVSDYVICADAGFITAQKANVKVDLVVGDFDSSVVPENAEKVIKLPIEKDDTDTFYAIKYAIKKGYKDFLLLGSIGGRLDHTFANYSILKYLYDNKLKAKIKDENTEIFYTRENFVIENKKGKTLSLFPFACDKCKVSYNGFKYQIKNHIIESNFPIGISNIIIDDYAIIDVQSGGALIIVLNKV